MNGKNWTKIPQGQPCKIVRLCPKLWKTFCKILALGGKKGYNNNKRNFVFPLCLTLWENVSADK
jgi:hypothetical protein